MKYLIENEETVEVSVKVIEQGLEEVKQILDGKLPRKTFAELKKRNGEWKMK